MEQKIPILIPGNIEVDPYSKENRTSPQQISRIINSLKLEEHKLPSDERVLLPIGMDEQGSRVLVALGYSPRPLNKGIDKNTGDVRFTPSGPNKLPRYSGKYGIHAGLQMLSIQQLKKSIITDLEGKAVIDEIPPQMAERLGLSDENAPQTALYLGDATHRLINLLNRLY